MDGANIGRGSNLLSGTLQVFYGKTKEISGPVAIFRNNGQDGSLARKNGYEIAVPFEDVAIVEELARQVRVQNNLPTYDEIMAAEQSGKEFSGRVAEVWKEIEANPVLIETIIQVRDHDPDGTQSLLEVDGRAIRTLVTDMGVLSKKNDDCIMYLGGEGENAIYQVSGKPGDFGIAPGLGVAILKKISELERSKQKELDAEE